LGPVKVNSFDIIVFGAVVVLTDQGTVELIAEDPLEPEEPLSPDEPEEPELPDEPDAPEEINNSSKKTFAPESMFNMAPWVNISKVPSGFIIIPFEGAVSVESEVRVDTSDSGLIKLSLLYFVITENAEPKSGR